MYLRHLLACITLQVCSTNLLYAAPCYTSTPGGCDENAESILVEVMPTKSGNLCTEFTKEPNKKALFCYPKLLETGDASPLRQKLDNSPPPTGTVVTIIPSHSGSSQPTSAPAPVVVQTPNDAYWEGYHRGYNDNSGYDDRDFRPVGNNDKKQAASSRSIKK